MFDLDITLVTWRTRGGELTVRKRGVDIVEASGERKYGEERSSTKIYLATIIYGWGRVGGKNDDILYVEASGIWGDMTKTTIRWMHDWATPVKEASKLVAERNAVAVVGAGELSVARQLLDGGDQVGQVQHQQHWGHPHPHGQDREILTFSSSQSLETMRAPPFSFRVSMDHHSSSETAWLTEIWIEQLLDEY